MLNTKDRFRHKTSWGKNSKWYGKIVGEKGHYYHQQVVLPAVMRMLKFEANDKVIDLGCGQGVLSRHIDKNIEYWGVDISGSLIKQATELNRNNKHKFVIGDISEKLNVPSNYFTKAAIILALQNIKIASKAIENTALVLKKDGLLVVVINHPCFRIPRQSGWDVDEVNKLQKRWIAKYMSPMDIPIKMHPSSKDSSVTWSFHEPLAYYLNSLIKNGLEIIEVEELTSDKESTGKQAKMENRSRAEIPLFMAIKAVKK